MPHIPLPPDLPGITGLLAFSPATGDLIAGLMQQLLRGDSPLTPGEREAIATHVSRLNGCDFCARSHGATARQLGQDPDAGEVDAKLHALLHLATAVTAGGRQVTGDEIAAARAAGAGDADIHDTVLIAAAFCMVNRYVDGLGGITPDDPEAYERMAHRLVGHGYARSAPHDVGRAT